MPLANYVSTADLPLSPLYLPGFYEPLRKVLNRAIGRDPNEQVFGTAIAAGAGSGIVGGEMVSQTVCRDVRLMDFLGFSYSYPWKSSVS